ncbi:4Fe-4S dicluster domain-containing protein [Sulfurovum sp. ST-21]|uniref:4Fe-4S dicluster domain-containing protein n=1 Tax=Sulfurovum indicum TaxID=2779528 RepID=A0A7M1S255_9BACT|nr:4Fe-4S dicluster domain-containing protein [Sulfurovum indicum]QOR61152.1 4Fe-4S dicluster domain-containing protein [Sulfurovum indicum]
MSKVIPKLFRINTGSCNGCDVEFVATAFVDKFQLDTLGIELVSDVKDANLLVITGPLSARSESFLKNALGKLKKPFVVVGIGTCSVSCGIFRDSYAINGPIDKFVEVDVNIAGCPPRPQSIAEGIAKGVKVLEQKMHGEATPKAIDTIFKDFSAPESFRGRMSLNEENCTACRTCETVCPSNAIEISSTDDGWFVHKIWHNSCCFCGNCAYFCPTDAIFATNSFDTAKLQSEKFSDVNIGYIDYQKCSCCGEMYMPPSQGLLNKSYIYNNVSKLNERICSKCRKEANFKRMYA